VALCAARRLEEEGRVAEPRRYRPEDTRVWIVHSDQGYCFPVLGSTRQSQPVAFYILQAGDLIRIGGKLGLKTLCHWSSGLVVIMTCSEYMNTCLPAIVINVHSPIKLKKSC
jgi:hypothetical protein